MNPPAQCQVASVGETLLFDFIEFTTWAVNACHTAVSSWTAVKPRIVEMLTANRSLNSSIFA